VKKDESYSESTTKTVAKSAPSTVDCVQGDFTKVEDMEGQFDKNAFDAIYAIESTVHAGDRSQVWDRAIEILKPGGILVSYEWVVTEKFDREDETHLRIKRGVEHGNGLPDLIYIKDVIEAAEKAGFEILSEKDLAMDLTDGKSGDDNSDSTSDSNNSDSNSIPWYQPLTAEYSWANFRSTKIGAAVTRGLLVVLELLGVAAPGSVQTQDMLVDGAVNLVEGGLLGIFTPMHRIALRKPANGGASVA
jgi:sterol 24-C-methyltransferase